MHRDISRNNLMYRKIDGKVYGVLNDFDLSVLWNKEPRSTSKQRIGTEPYMAVDLLVVGPPPPHLYRFDLESLFYVVAYGTISPQPLSVHIHLQRLTLLLHKMFRDAYNARTDAQTLAFLDSSPTDFKDDTVDRLITFDKFEKIFVTHLPSSA
ncbi:hypothetical protein GGX14DRAFT_581489 [Mycena pura]|uniref:Protein kinase domain-containing protein n=1 Tax=Mycena pura TaxID=153505 RepID=A0AAD6YUH6_9AGAR|nr:hypothetical protein GGX14DRAFT_581489 [Mycena pura]